MRPMIDVAQLEAWFVTGSQDLYGEAVLARVDEDARHIATCLDEARTVPVRIVPDPRKGGNGVGCRRPLNGG